MLFHILRARAKVFIARCHFSSHLPSGKLKTVYFLTPNKSHFCSLCPYIFIDRKLMDLSTVIKTFEKHIPPNLAESWDNTGLLIEPSKAVDISTVLFTNDLTEAVLNEAIAEKCNLIISYHPPIFTPLKSLKIKNWKERIVLKCIEKSIAVYSPHTACDAVANGVNDWLIDCFDITERRPIKQSFAQESTYSYSLEFTLKEETNLSEISRLPECELSSVSSKQDGQHFRLKASENALIRVMQLCSFKNAISSMSLIPLSKLPAPSCGMGRIGTLTSPKTLADCIKDVKSYLNLPHIRFAHGVSHNFETEISVVAVCAGSGSSILKGVKADLYITGEMSHHDILDANHKNVSVILCEHTNSERGYLNHLINVLRSDLTSVKLLISSVDKDPICTV